MLVLLLLSLLLLVVVVGGDCGVGGVFVAVDVVGVGRSESEISGE